MARRVRVEMGHLTVRLREFDENLDKAMRVLTKVQSSRSTTYMRTNAPWTDRTTNARNGLHVLEDHEEDHWRLILSHTMHYGIYLEIMNAGEFEIILPSVIHGADELWRSITKLFAIMEKG